MKRIKFLTSLSCVGLVTAPVLSITACSQQTFIVVLYAGQGATFSNGKDYKIFPRVKEGTKLYSIPGIDEIPTRQDYQFVSWVNDKQETIDKDYVIKGDLTLESKWLQVTGQTKIKLHANGGKFKTHKGYVDELEIDANIDQNLYDALYGLDTPRVYDGKKETKDEIYFDHWSLSQDSKEKIDPNFTIPREGLDLYACYFDPISPSDVSDEGIVLLENNELKNSDQLALPMNNDDKEHTLHVFGLGGYSNGWRFQGNGSGKGYDSGSNPDKVQLIDALSNTNFKVNQDLANKYLNSGVSSEVPVTEAANENYKLCEIKPDCFEEWLDGIKNDDISNDTALFVLSRYGGEGNELPKFQYKILRDTHGEGTTTDAWDYNHIYSHITDEESKMLKDVCNSGFKRVVVLINSTNPMEMDFLKNPEFKIDAALYMPTSGTQGTLTVPKVLDGTVNPSGHLTDTIAYDFSTAPSYQNTSWVGENNQAFSDDYRIKPRRFLDENENPRENWANYTAYMENIYIGYYWYETANAEGYWNNKNEYPNGYDSVVQYPFGYGKSYTNFDWLNPTAEIINGSEENLNLNSEIQFKVTVKNTGSLPGKDAVQFYVEKPWDKNQPHIEKPAIQLIGFAKTKLLQPNESETVVVRTRLCDFADYDCYDADRDGFFGYELEKGSYTFSLRRNVHERLGDQYEKHANVGFGQGGNFHYDTDMDTGYKVKNLFTNYSYDSLDGTHYETTNTDKHPDDGICRSIDGSDLNGEGIGSEYLSRQKGFAETYPTQPLTNVKLSDNDFNKTFKVLTSWDDYEGQLPKQDQDGDYEIKDLNGKSYDDPLWDKLLDELSYDDLITLVKYGNFGTREIARIKKPKTSAKDGPCGFNSVDDTTCEDTSPTCYPSDTMIGSTWNIDISYAVGKTMGYEGKWLNGNLTENYGPGLNIHRSPLGGRNFEYYSEDPYLSGAMCSWQISGAKEEGMTTYIKHFVLNDNDTGRNGKYNFCTEQTLRQVYCKPFEMVAKGAFKYKVDANNNVIVERALKGNALMGSVDRIGTTRVTGSYNLLTEVLRNEWGFRGSVITDYYQSGDVNDVDEGIRAGNDLMLNGANNCEFDDTLTNTFKYYVRQAAKNVLYTYIDSIYCGLVF